MTDSEQIAIDQQNAFRQLTQKLRHLDALTDCKNGVCRTQVYDKHYGKVREITHAGETFEMV